MTSLDESSQHTATGKNAVIGSFDFSGHTVLVAGLGISGRSVAHILTQHGVPTITVDERNNQAERTSFDDLPWDTITLVVTSPGFPPSTPFLQIASQRGIPVWSEVEFAWRTKVARSGDDGHGEPAPWIGITGTNGKTTTTEMTSAIMAAAGRKVPAVGNIGEPVSSAVLDPSNEEFCVELSSFALHFTNSLSLDVAIWTNVAADHLDWHGGFDNYAADKSKVFTSAKRAIVFNADDPVVSRYAADARVEEGCKKVGFTLKEPAEGQLGIVDGWIVDRSGLSKHIADVDGGLLISLDSLKNLSEPNGTVYPHLLADCMAATAACLAMGVSLASIREALSAFRLDAHRIACVGSFKASPEAAPVLFIDDSKATNAHAAAASLSSFKNGSVVWIAGGLAKGARFDDLVEAQKHVMRAVVLIGVDQEPFTEALDSHAPQIPVTAIDAARTKNSTEVMQRAIDAAMKYAEPGDVVLLAPAAASMDQFVSYVDRGDQFAQQAQAWVKQHA